jgi:hypothetical protein
MPTAVEHHLVFRYCQEKLRVAEIWRAIQNVCYLPGKAAGRVAGALPRNREFIGRSTLPPLLLRVAE